MKVENITNLLTRYSDIVKITDTLLTPIYEGLVHDIPTELLNKEVEQLIPHNTLLIVLKSKNIF